MKPLSFHPALDAEVLEAAQFCEARQTGLGDELLLIAEQAKGDIQRAPTRCQFVSGIVRKRRLTRFPYTLIFENHPDRILILAFAHDRRHPDYWKSRLTPGE